MNRVDHAPALEARLVRKVHPGLTVDVDLTLGPERGVVFGPSGAGKSTLLRLIAGLERPDGGFLRLSGSTLFDSGPRTDVPLRDRRIGMVFQDDLLFPHLTVLANLRFGLKGRPSREALARSREVAALCGVLGLLDRLPGALSGGERQRVGLARALAPRPRLLLCDEPVSALDLTSRSALVDSVRAVQEAEGVPMLYVTHDPAEAVALGTTLFVMREGRLVDHGPPIDVLARAGGPGPLAGLRNVFSATALGPAGSGPGATRVQLDGGPVLVVPDCPEVAGTPLTVEVKADDVLLASGVVEGLSARNQLAGTVDRVIPHGGEAEVLVRTGVLGWVVSVVGEVVGPLGLRPGAPVTLIVKARSCRVSRRGPE